MVKRPILKSRRSSAEQTPRSGPPKSTPSESLVCWEAGSMRPRSATAGLPCARNAWLGYLAPVLRGWPRKWTGLGVLLVGLALPVAAHAEEKARLVYVRGDGAGNCPAEVDLRLWVMARLGYDPFSPQASRVVIARVEAREHELFSSVEVADQAGLSTGRRELSSKNERCQELARAMALSISLAIDPERASLARDEAVAATTPAPAPTPPSTAPPPRVPAPPFAQQEATHSRVFLRGAFESGVGQLPGLALDGALGVGLRFRRTSLAVEGRGALTLGADLTPPGSLTGSLLVAGLTACAHFGAIGLCAIGYVGQQRLGTRDVAQPNTSSGPYLSLGSRQLRSLLAAGELGRFDGDR
jgi:hypothetical protein